MRGIPTRQLGSITLIGLFTSQLYAQNFLCDTQEITPSAQFRYGAYQAAAAEPSLPLQEEESRVSETNIWFSSTEDSGVKKSWGFSHHYRIFDFPDIAGNKLQTNGHQHRLSVRRHWQKSQQQNTHLSEAEANPQKAPNQWRLGIAPVLAISSNLLKNPEEIGRQAWQLHLHLEYRYTLNPQWQILLGGCVDDRFDHYRGYPLVGVLWQPIDDIRLRLAFPRSGIDFQLTRNWSLSLELAPNGSIWQVYNQDLNNLSRLRYRSWQLTAGLLWQMDRQWALGLEWGREFEREFHFRSITGTAENTEVDSVNFAAASISWRW